MPFSYGSVCVFLFVTGVVKGRMTRTKFVNMKTRRAFPFLTLV